MKLSESMSEQEEMEYFLFEDGLVAGKRYKARSQYWRDKGLWHSGYFREINQINLELMLYKGESDNLEQTINSLEKVIPLLKDRDGTKHLGIFEHTLSENGSWCVEIDGEGYHLVRWYYQRKSVNKSFNTLRELVVYVQKHHYYESSEDSYSEDD